MAAAAILKSAIFEQIRDKFDTETENKVPGQVYLRTHIRQNPRWGGRHTENNFYLASIANTGTEFDTDAAENGSHSHIYVKIYTVQKSKMAAAAVLKSVKRP